MLNLRTWINGQTSTKTFLSKFIVLVFLGSLSSMTRTEPPFALLWLFSSDSLNVLHIFYSFQQIRLGKTYTSTIFKFYILDKLPLVFSRSFSLYTDIAPHTATLPYFFIWPRTTPNISPPTFMEKKNIRNVS